MSINASIIDYPRANLDKELWKVDGESIELQPRVRDQILDVVMSLLDDLHLPNEALLDVFIYGSILSNQYNSKTDVDARILLDGSITREMYPKITGDALYEITRDNIHGVLLEGTAHPLNATIVIEGEDTVLGQSPLGTTAQDPVYSLKKGKIVHEGAWKDEDFDPETSFKQEKDEADGIMEKLDKLIQNLRTETVDYELIEEAVGEVKDPQKLIDRLEDKLENIEGTIEQLTEEYEKLHKERDHAYKNAPKNDRHSGPGNIRYKMLEKYRYIDLLKKLKRMFEGGITKRDVPEVAEAVKVSGSKKRAEFPPTQRGPAQEVDAPPTSMTMPPLEQNPEAIEGGGMMHGAACPYCGYANTINGKDSGKKTTCGKCGKQFSVEADQPLAINSGPGTIMDSNTPYPSDIPVYGATQSDIDESAKVLEGLGVQPTVIDDFKNRVTKPGTGTQPQEAEKARAPNTAQPPVDPGAPEAPQTPSAPQDTQGEQPTDKTIVPKTLTPPKVMPKMSWRTFAYLTKVLKSLGDTPMKTASLFDDGMPGKEPGSDPYADTGKPLAEGAVCKRDKCKEPNKDEDLIMEVVTVLDGEDILPFLKDDELIEDLLGLWPRMGDPDPKMDKLLDKALSSDKIPRKVVLTSKRAQLIGGPTSVSEVVINKTPEGFVVQAPEGYTGPEFSELGTTVYEFVEDAKTAAQAVFPNAQITLAATSKKTSIIADPISLVDKLFNQLLDVAETEEQYYEIINSIVEGVVSKGPSAASIGKVVRLTLPSSVPADTQNKVNEAYQEFIVGVNNATRSDSEYQDVLYDVALDMYNERERVGQPTAHKHAMNEPDDGKGQYVAPTEIDYDESPKKKLEKEPSKLAVEKARDIGEKIGIDWETSPFSPMVFMHGMEVELKEHGSYDPETDVTHDNLEMTGKIAWSHLKEKYNYYELLEEMEKEASEMARQARAFMTLCPNCKSIQRADYWEDTQCPNCYDKIPGYFWKNTQDEMTKGGPREPVPEYMRDQFEDATNVQKTAQLKPRLDPKTQDKINSELIAAGLDGNGRFDEPGNGYSVAFNVLADNGVEPTETFSWNGSDNGKIHQGIAWSNPEDSFSPVDIENAGLVLTWHKFEETGKYEIIAYVA